MMQKKEEDLHRYDDMLDLPHHVSSSHPPMAVYDRAAQFSPFAALTGYESVIQETARTTERRVELDEYRKAELDALLQVIQARAASHPELSITYFVPDERKDGGAYVTVSGCVKKIDGSGRVLVLMDGTGIPIDEILEITMA